MYIGRKGIFMRQEYLQAVAGRIKDKTARRQILEELESHLLDKIDYYTEIGYSPEEAEKRAVEEMGDPDDTALPLSTMSSLLMMMSRMVSIFGKRRMLSMRRSMFSFVMVRGLMGFSFSSDISFFIIAGS